MFLLLHFSLQNLVLSSRQHIFHLPYCPYKFSALPPQDPWSVLSARVDIPGLLSVNAGIYELGKETFQSALFSTVYSQYVTGHGKRAHFAHYFKIELLVFKGSVYLKQ